jgi:hypothetical protein
MQNLLLKIHEDLNNEPNNESHPFLDYVYNDKSDNLKNEIAKELAEKYLELEEAHDKIIENRKWINKLMHEYAPLRILCTSPEDTSKEKSKNFHPCFVGLFEYAEEVIKLQFPEDLEKFKDINATFEYLRILSLRKDYYLSIANLFRVYLDDCRDEGDWFRPYFNSICAMFEAEIREKLFIERPCQKQHLCTEVEFIKINLLNGEADPHRDVIYAKPYPDWKR